MQVRSGFFWERTLDIGVHDGWSHWQRTRVRLLNGICLLNVAFLFFYACLFRQADAPVFFWGSVQGVALYTAPIILNHYRRYGAARFFFFLYSTLLYTFFAVAHGTGYGTEYFLLPVSICALLFFRDMKIVVALFLFNCLCFALCKYSFVAMRPFIQMPSSVNAYYINHVSLFLAMLLIVLYFRLQNNQQEDLLALRADQMEAERKNADELLLNILPAAIAEELKTTGAAQPRLFEQVTVLFTNFENAALLSERLAAEELVAEINHCFSAFDGIMQRHGVEKIKTAGDAYLCVCGLGEHTDNPPAEVINAALDIRNFMQQYKAQRNAAGRPSFNVRIGIHTGPLVAGVVGLKKFAYDIWGDTVNTASRMQSSGAEGKINVSGATYELIKDEFLCTPRGKVQAKNKGMIEMYFVDGRRMSDEE